LRNTDLALAAALPLRARRCRGNLQRPQLCNVAQTTAAAWSGCLLPVQSLSWQSHRGSFGRDSFEMKRKREI
jgi:hypothetical protein